MDLAFRSEGRQRLEAAVASIGLQTSESDQARLWLWLGILWGTAAPALTVAALERAVELYRRLRDASELANSLTHLGGKLALLGRSEQAARVLAEAAPLLKRAGAPKMLAIHFEALGFLKMCTGELADARMHFEKALSLYRGAGAEYAALAMLISLADITWALGDLDAALAGFREAIALIRKSALFSKDMLGACLTNLSGVHTERGELVEALAAASEGLPVRNKAGYGWICVDHLALRAALAGKLANAARVAGYADWTRAAKQSPRQPNEARARDRLHALLREKLAADELERLLAEGAKMSEGEACRVALEE